MRTLVIGAGAIGGYVGARLALAGHAVTLLGRQPLAEAVAACGLRLIEPEGEFEIRDCRVATSMIEAFPADVHYDLALFTVKTCDTQAAIDEVRPFAPRVDRFLPLQNGVNGEDRLGEAFGRGKIIAGTMLNPVTIRAPGVVVLEKRRGGIGLSAVSTDVGVVSRRSPQRSGGDRRRPENRSSNQPTIQPTADYFRQAGFVIRTYADYRSMKWSKLLLNLIGNATSAILDLNTLQVFVDKRVFAIEVAMLREAMRVARSIGIRFVGLPGYPVPLLAAAVRFLPLPLLQPLLIPLVAKGRGSKMPSLHIDLHGGKRRSEIDELNGAVVRAGTQTGIPTPVNALLVDTFQDLMTGRAERSAWRRVDRLWEACAAVSHR